LGEFADILKTLNSNNKRIMKSVCLIALITLSCLKAQATITFNSFWGDLQTANPGTPMPSTGLVLLVASPDATFGGPLAGAFATGGDVVLFHGSLGSPGVFEGPVTVDLSSFPSLTAGNPLQLYWFPTLTVADYDDTVTPGPGAGTAYGSYRDAAGAFSGSAPWVIPPGANDVVSLNFATISQSGQSPDALGVAIFTVVPEASNLITAALALGLCVFRLTRSARQKVI
jgi:hypothetical protein